MRVYVGVMAVDRKNASRSQEEKFKTKGFEVILWFSFRTPPPPHLSPAMGKNGGKGKKAWRKIAAPELDDIAAAEVRRIREGETACKLAPLTSHNTREEEGG